MKQAIVLVMAAIIVTTALNAMEMPDKDKRHNSGEVKIQLIRNATMKLVYGGKTFLTDPMLSKKGEIRSFAGIASNPTVELPLPLEELLSGVDAVIVSHLHPDHYHNASGQAILLAKPVFCQPVDSGSINKDGFALAKPIQDSEKWENIVITRVAGKHGSDSILEKMGEVSGFVFQAENLPTVYWAGDTVWCEEVAETIRKFAPQIIITHSGGATIPGFAPILMNAQQTVTAANTAPNAILVAVHLESLDHCRVSRNELRVAANEAGIKSSRLFIPENGETLVFPAKQF